VVRVERTIRALPGVADVTVKFATERASVAPVPASAVDTDAVEAAVKAAGYAATSVRPVTAARRGEEVAGIAPVSADDRREASIPVSA